jgi:uncharacterized protein (DUF1499 family)
MILAWWTLFDGILALILAIVGIIWAHFGVLPPFHLQLSPALFGLYSVLLGFFIAILGFIIGVVALLVTFLMPSRRAGRARAVMGTILALIVAVPIVRITRSTRQYPPINDITTDTKNPPLFVYAQTLPANRSRDMSYKPEMASAQEAAPVYRNLAPLKLPGRPDDVYKRVEIIAGEFPGWQVTYRDPARRTIEGVATSTLFQFKDDFVIQVRPADDSNDSLVEMRSKSRDGKGDLGANYNRIESFFKALQGPPRGVGVQSSSNHEVEMFWQKYLRDVRSNSEVMSRVDFSRMAAPLRVNSERTGETSYLLSLVSVAKLTRGHGNSL